MCGIYGSDIAGFKYDNGRPIIKGVNSTIYDTGKIYSGHIHKHDVAGNVTSYELSARMGAAPQKICVPLGFKWCLEYKPLYEAYPGFKDWTTGAADTWAGNYNSSLVY